MPCQVGRAEPTCKWPQHGCMTVCNELEINPITGRSISCLVDGTVYPPGTHWRSSSRNGPSWMIGQQSRHSCVWGASVRARQNEREVESGLSIGLPETILLQGRPGPSVVQSTTADHSQTASAARMSGASHQGVPAKIFQTRSKLR